MKKTLEEQMIHAAYWKDSDKVFELMALGAQPFCKDGCGQTVPDIAKKGDDMETFEVFWKCMRRFHPKLYRRVIARSQPNRILSGKYRERTI